MNKKLKTEQETCYTATFNTPYKGIQVTHEIKDKRTSEEKMLELKRIFTILLWGMGTTGIAGLKTNRSFIGIELDENYFNIAKERINSYVVQEGKNE
jgi:hypothetical protein